MNCTNGHFHQDHSDPLPGHCYSPVVGTIVNHEQLIIGCRQNRRKIGLKKQKKDQFSSAQCVFSIFIFLIYFFIYSLCTLKIGLAFSETRQCDKSMFACDEIFDMRKCKKGSKQRIHRDKRKESAAVQHLPMVLRFI